MTPTILITGATSGIGLAAANEMAIRGWHVLAVGRSPERCEQARHSILIGVPDAQITYFVADLSSQRAIRSLANQVMDTLGYDALDVLVNNAGTVTSRYTETEDGIELQFAVNHLAPFLLTQLLLPALQKTPEARVITTSSSSHYTGRMHWQDPMLKRGYSLLKAYEQSKLANVLFSVAFNSRYAPLRAYAADPGLVNTEMGSKGTGLLEDWFWRLRKRGGASPQQGAATLIHLASTPEITDPDAVYWKDCQPKLPSRAARDPDNAERLWQLSQVLCPLN